ncbi:MAG: hypothetical protein U5R48_12590 [Gammaproteobacteria bacterium]|nr:hypothetical protein [Gammaproteobacteria bacterium]
MGTGAYAAGVGPQNTFNIPSGDAPSGTLDRRRDLLTERVRGTFSFHRHQWNHRRNR